MVGAGGKPEVSTQVNSPNFFVKTRPVDAALASDIMNDTKVAHDDTDDEEEDSQSQCPDSDGEEEPDLADTDDDDNEEDS